MSTSGGTAGVGAGGGTTSASGGAKGGSAGAKGSGDDEEVDPRDAAAMQHLDDMIQRVIDFEPEMFKLRTPASLWRRTAAGLQDLAVAVTVGAAAALPPVLLDLITEDTAAVVGVIGATAMWSLRDCCTSEGNRSWGKKTWGLELVFFSGDLPPRALTFIRNLYWWLLPAAMFYPVSAPASPVTSLHPARCAVRGACCWPDAVPPPPPCHSSRKTLRSWRQPQTCRQWY